MTMFVVFLFWCKLQKWKWNIEAKGKARAQRGDPRLECWVEFSSSALWNFICALMGATVEPQHSLKSIPKWEEKLWTDSFILILTHCSLFFPFWLLKGTGSDLGDLWLPHHMTFSSLAELFSLKLPTRTKSMERKKAEIHVHETV